MKYMYLSAILIFSLISPVLLLAQEQAAEVPMKTYYMALLKAGENRNQSANEASKIQEGHMAHINQMAKEGKLVLARPFLDDGDLKGVFIFEVESMEEAIVLTERDPTV